MAELADALDSKSSVVALRAGSSPAFGTKEICGSTELEPLFYLSENKQKILRYTNFTQNVFLRIVIFRKVELKKDVLLSTSFFINFIY